MLRGEFIALHANIGKQGLQLNGMSPYQEGRHSRINWKTYKEGCKEQK